MAPRLLQIGYVSSPGATPTRGAARIRRVEEWSIRDDGLIAASLGHYNQAEYERQLQQGAKSRSSE